MMRFFLVCTPKGFFGLQLDESQGNIQNNVPETEVLLSWEKEGSYFFARFIGYKQLKRATKSRHTDPG